jgi:hypothetical protein
MFDPMCFLFFCRAYSGFDSVIDYPANRVMLGSGLVFHNYVDWSWGASPWSIDSTIPDMLHTNAGYALDALRQDLSDAAPLSGADALTALDTLDNTMDYLFSAYDNFTSFFDHVEAFKTEIIAGPDQLVYPSEDHKFYTNDNVFLTFLVELDTDYASSLPAHALQAHPAHADFPGNFSASVASTTKYLNISGDYAGQSAELSYSHAGRARMHSTGLYMRAGSLLSVRVPAAAAASGELGIHVSIAVP